MMQASFQDVIRTWVVLRNAEINVPVARIVDVIIQPDTGKIEAFWTNGPEGLKLLCPMDIKRWQDEWVYIDEITDLVEVDEHPRLKTVLEKEHPLMQQPVYRYTDRTLLGFVQSLSLDLWKYELIGIRVQKKWWRRVFLPKSQIRTIESMGVYVDDLNLAAHSKPQAT